MYSGYGDVFSDQLLRREGVNDSSLSVGIDRSRELLTLAARRADRKWPRVREMRLRIISGCVMAYGV